VLFTLLAMLFLVFLYSYHLIRFSDKNFHLIFCNVGQGDGILIRTPEGHDIIIDGGPQENSLTDCLTRHLPFWDRDIDIVYMTHPDSDHLTGLIGVVKSYNVKYFGTPKVKKETGVYDELMALLENKKIPVDWLIKGDAIKIKTGFSMVIHWPTKEFAAGIHDDANDYSLVQKVTYGNFNALLTGDVASVYLNSIMPLAGTIDVFKPPHHGSKTGVDEFTFQHNIPRFAVISAGLKNKYHHPAPEVLNLLREAGIPYKDTMHGDIEIVSDGVKWWVVKQ
jgi:competence protein ComEC